MRKLLIPLMLASVALPGAATARERGDHSSASRERPAESRKERSAEDRPQRSERAARPERPQNSEPAARMDRPDRMQGAERAARIERLERPDRPRSLERAARIERADRPERIKRAERVRSTGDVDRTVTSQEVEQRHVRTARQVDHVRRVDRADDSLVGGFRTIAREQSNDGAFTGRTETRRGDRTTDRRHRWSSDWRRDHRYDWRNYRHSHRSLFRLSRYYDPYGWNYRRFSIGFSLGSSYYGSNYWLNDPWMYRLPPAYGPYRWVRYYDDALLVNIYTGQVVDVLYNFFW